MLNALFQMAPQALKAPMRQLGQPMQYAGGSPGWIPNNPGVIFNPQQRPRIPMWGQDMARRWQWGGQYGSPGARFNDPLRNSLMTR